jgi:CRISPR-associated endonuclease/helicase Cas3
MGELTHTEFASFFRAVWGFDPFPWQEDLVQRLATGRDPRRDYDGAPGVWPDVLDLPTGSGKTAALDIAVFHLALDARRGSKRRAPVRIAFVVDRRLIVDDAFARAQRLSEALAWSLLGDDDAKALQASRPVLAEVICRVRAEPVVKRMALQLRKLAGPDQPPLIARALRGGAPREDDWARTPVQPTILCSTVDQVGSRLLFRGYGVTDRMKPIHAGLLGSDCLILLDEAHLSEPFRQTLKGVERLRVPDRAPFDFAVLTATPGQDRNGRDTELKFTLSPADEAHPILARRIIATKPARLIESTGKQGVDTESRRAEVAAEQTRSILERLQAGGIAHPAVAVVVNRVARARAVFNGLQAELKDVASIILLIGPVRAVDRDALDRKLELIRTRNSEASRDLPEPFIVVATQTIEAGVDIDFDGLVTEAASFDALKQRFGRLNRAGRNIKAEAVILAHKDDLGAKADDPVYGDRIRATWDKLQQLAVDSAGAIDFGIAAFRARVDPDEAANLVAPTKNAPVLMPAYADLWSQTSPIPNADPEVALFLHGPNRGAASVQIVWRADINEQNDLRPAMGDDAKARGRQGRLIELLKLVPPRAAEAIEIPLWAARAWLEETNANQADFSDVAEREAEAAEKLGAGRRAFRWAGEDSERTGVIFASALRNGDLIVVPAEYGGCDRWGWAPNSNEPVIDVAQKAAWPYRARHFAVRVTPALITQGLNTEEREAHSSRTEELATLLAEADTRNQELLKVVRELEFLPEDLKTCLSAFDRCRGQLKLELSVYGVDEEERPRGIVFLAPRGLNVARELAALPVTEDEGLGALADQPIPLLDHSRHVCDWTDEFAFRAGLTPELRKDIALSGWLHDPGKADPRYQAYYAGGDPYGPDLTVPLAKSGQRRLPRGAWERAGLPSNWRHEALSVRLAMSHPDFARAHDLELVLWLIGTHHGYGRPLFPHADPHDAEDRTLEVPGPLGGKLSLAAGLGPQSLAFDFNGQDWAQLFKTLNQRYGIWGLARLEAYVRLADHRASEEGASPPTVRRYEEAAE